MKFKPGDYVKYTSEAGVTIKARVKYVTTAMLGLDYGDMIHKKDATLVDSRLFLAENIEANYGDVNEDTMVPVKVALDLSKSVLDLLKEKDNKDGVIKLMAERLENHLGGYADGWIRYFENQVDHGMHKTPKEKQQIIELSNQVNKLKELISGYCYVFSGNENFKEVVEYIKNDYEVEMKEELIVENYHRCEGERG